jgi:tRNA(Ile)-lysidine synthase
MEWIRGVLDRLRRLAPEARHVLLGVSGGADSVAALRLFHAAGIRLTAAHFDHRLRPQSGADAAFVTALCTSLALPCEQGAADVGALCRERGWNLEDGARRLRYAFLAGTAKRIGADVVVVAHTRDDQAETVLQQLLRGCAFAGGMAPRHGHVVRPLLDTPHATLTAYLDALGQGYREDASNRDENRTRAWLRHQILPLLEARAPGAAARLAATAQDQRRAEAALRRWAGARFGQGPIPLHALRSAPPALRRAGLADRLERAGAAVTRSRLEDIEAALERDTPWRQQLGPKAHIRVAYGRLEVIGPPRPALPAAVVRDAGALPPGVDPAVLDGPGELSLRSRRPGDRIALPGGSRLLSDVLIDRKVPREERDGLRLLARAGQVLWVEGVVAAPGVATLPIDPDLGPMRRALEAARAAAEAGETPVGAVVVVDGEIVAAAGNATEAEHDPSAHAELRALRGAAAALGDWRLPGGALYVTLEPCPMCFGAVLQTRLARVVYGADNPREGALGGVLDLRDGDWKRRPEVRSGVLARDAARLMSAFFRRRRPPST